MTEPTLEKQDDKEFLEWIAKLVRAFEGLPPDSETAVQKLIDMKNILERSRFPTYPILQKQVYLRLLDKYNTTEDKDQLAESCLSWADFEAHALVQYKGLGREEFVTMNKAPAMTPQNEFILGSSKQTQGQEIAKRHFWNREPKPEEELKQ